LKKLSILIIIFSLLLFSCLEDFFEDTFGNSSKKFWAQNFSTETFYQVNAELLAENDKCSVWVEKGSRVTKTTAKSVADEYKNTIYVKMMNTFGYTVNDPALGRVNNMEIAHWLATGETKNAKLTILLLDIKDGYRTESDPYVGGYFYAVDLLENNPNHPQLKYSNERDMIYLDTYPSVVGSSSSYESLAHEMQHLMNFVASFVCRFDGVTLNLMDTWVDEGLSSAAEWIYTNQHPEVRWRYYNEDRSKLIAKGNNFFLWNNHKDESPLANLDDYATVYLFFQYLRLQSGDQNNKIYFDIQTSDFYDYQAVTKADNINSSHKDKWPLLLRDWHAANYINNSSGLYGYKNDPVLKGVKAPVLSSNSTSLPLFPGEGVYSKTTTAESVPTVSGTGNIKYAGLDSAGSSPNETTGFIGGVRLTYNVNTNENGAAETGQTTGIAASVGVSMTDSRSSIQTGLNKFSGPFKVGADYFRRINGNNLPDNEIRSVINKINGRQSNKNGNVLNIDKTTIERVFIDE